MSSHNFTLPQCLDRGLVMLAGSFIPLTGAGTVAAASVIGQGFGYAKTNGVTVLQPAARPGISGTPGIVRTGVGVYTITLDDSYLGVNYWDVNFAAPTAAGTVLNAVPVAGPTGLAAGPVAPVFTFVIVNGSGTPTEASALARVHFLMILRNSTVGDQRP